MTKTIYYISGTHCWPHNFTDGSPTPLWSHSVYYYADGSNYNNDHVRWDTQLLFRCPNNYAYHNDTSNEYV